MTDDEIHEKRAFLTHCGDRATTPHEEVIIDHGVALADEALQRGASISVIAARHDALARVYEHDANQLATARELLERWMDNDIADATLTSDTSAFLAGAPA